MHALLLAVALAAAPTLAPAPEPLADLAPPAAEADPSVYRVGKLDLAVTALAVGAAVAPNPFTTRLIRRSCLAPGSCSPDSVNVLDRFAVDLHSKAADVTSDVTVALSVLVPVAADGLRLGLAPAFREDVLVLTETLAVNSALVM